MTTNKAQEVRDWVIKHPKGKTFNSTEIANDLDMTTGPVAGALNELLARKVIRIANIGRDKKNRPYNIYERIRDTIPLHRKRRSHKDPLAKKFLAELQQPVKTIKDFTTKELIAEIKRRAG